jgi:hypothetical protein
MSKILIGVLSGVFVGAAIYELAKRFNPKFITMAQDLAISAVDELSGYRTESEDAGQLL